MSNNNEIFAKGEEIKHFKTVVIMLFAWTVTEHQYFNMTHLSTQPSFRGGTNKCKHLQGMQTFSGDKLIPG